MEQRMYGVVLWADERDRKAVIWCEDHGSLAYFNDEESSSDQFTLDPGDLIHFEVAEEAECRLARNLEHVGPGWAPHLPVEIRQTDTQSGSPSNIVPFPGRVA